MNERFTVIFLEDAAAFLDRLDDKAREKILYNIYKACIINDEELFKKLSEEIWEFRTLFNKIQYRLLLFWDKTESTPTIVAATHGIIKKTRKVPKKEIEKAVQIMKVYFEIKKEKNGK